MLRITVLVIAENEEHKGIQEQAETQVVNAHGGLLKMKEHLHVGQPLLLRNLRSKMEMNCRVVATEEAGLEYYNVAFEFERPAPHFWPVVFPPANWGVGKKTSTVRPESE